MKTLYLVRHAKSSWKAADLTDFERPLNKRGKRDAPYMGKLLRKQGTKPDLIISSPAKRALKTARILAEEMKYPKKKISSNELVYGTGVEELLRVIREIDNSYHAIMIVGHNPALTSLANFLVSPGIENIPTCGILSLNFSFNSWQKVTRNSGQLSFFEYPKKYFP